jgi:hypothetical protein
MDTFDTWIFVFSLVDGLGLLFLIVYFVSFTLICIHFLIAAHFKLKFCLCVVDVFVLRVPSNVGLLHARLGITTVELVILAPGCSNTTQLHRGRTFEGRKNC